ncbi:hypothetical protein EK21DRAFT_97541 [Setomelanomma holmii]|uniref:Mating-type protein MAT-1 n=1 Tax=Setomelanomma holmii TaxID=210430 RepID=A0A9P4HJL1_9PLEO|nr:hypothetical protein EK21DRAFT_97541 [Setomelanomma holmii]
MYSKLLHIDANMPRDSFSPHIDDFLQARSGREIVAMMRDVSSPAAQAALTAALLLSPPVVDEPMPATTPEKAKKALNAFTWPMKTLSHLVGQLWEAEPNKSLWSLMAKAWSSIRDQVGNENAPLDKFFQSICPYLKISSPDTYLESHGWKLHINNEVCPVLVRDSANPLAASISAGFADMAISVEDITSICQQTGYAPNYVPKLNMSSSTFLGRSVNPAPEKGKQQPSITDAESSFHTVRVVARNVRRVRRQTVKESSTAPALRQQIAMAQTEASDQNSPRPDATSIELGADPFYEFGEEAFAFRAGADGNATLPSIYEHSY